MATLTFDVTSFRTQFPKFSNVTTYPDATLQMNWDNATCYISDSDFGRLNGACRQRAIDLMTAHLTFSADLIAAGETNTVLNSARIDNISISTRPPPSVTQWQWWLNSTPYGIQLLSLLRVKSVGGFYIGSRPERSGFRKVGGGF